MQNFMTPAGYKPKFKFWPTRQLVKNATRLTAVTGKRPHNCDFKLYPIYLATKYMLINVQFHEWITAPHSKPLIPNSMRPPITTTRPMACLITDHTNKVRLLPIAEIV